MRGRAGGLGGESGREQIQVAMDWSLHVTGCATREFGRDSATPQAIPR